MARIQLLSPARVRRTVARLAFEVIERNRGGAHVVIFGIRRRGMVIATMLAEALAEVEQHNVPVHALDMTAFRDDRPGKEESLKGELPRVEDRDVLLVDDVLFTGRTARAAIDAVLSCGRPRTIQLAVLIDRGHREVPIQPDFVGRVIPTKHAERIVVDVEGETAVYLEE